MFSVIKFDGEGCVEVAPTSWIDHKTLTVRWPPGPASNPIKLCKPFQPNWSTHKIKIFKTADSFKRACALRLEAATASGLDTTDAEDVPKKGNKRKLPKIDRKSKQKRKSAVPTDSSSESEIESTPSSIASENLFSTNELNEVYSKANIQSNLSFEEEEFDQIDSSSSRPLAIQDLQFVNNSMQDTFKEVVIRELSEIKSDLRELLSRVRTNLSNEPDQIQFPFELPLKTTEEVEKLENWLNSTSSNKSSLIAQLSSFGGAKTADITRRILRELFAPGLARKYNFTGGGSHEKLAFEKLSLNSVVISATRRNKKADQVTVHDIECVIKLWFRNSRDLEGDGARKRVRKVSKTTTPN